MAETLINAISAIQQNPQRTDLVVGFMGLCVTLKSPDEQSSSLSACAKSILSVQPLLALKLLELALMISPRNQESLEFAREVFRRRGRWSAEQRVIEFMSTLTQVAATTQVPVEILSKTAIPTAKPAPTEPEVQQPEEQMQSEEKENLIVQESVPAASDQRIVEFLKRCGFDQSLTTYAAGVSQTNAGLVAFVSMLISLGLIRADELMLAGIMLQKMIIEKPDESGANALFERLFPDLSSHLRGGKS